MAEDVFNPSYWAERLRKCDGELHRSIFNGSIDQFSPIHQQHRAEVPGLIGRAESVLDAGCGYGRLLDCMSPHWTGRYLGVDICPEFIKVAKVLHPDRSFIICDLRELGAWLDQWDPIVGRTQPVRFDVAVVSSVKPMVIRNAGQAEWDRIEAELRRVARRLVFLEFGGWD